MDYILASKSPRRKELMKKISSVFIIQTKEIDESVSYFMSPEEAVKDIAYRKGIEIAKQNVNSIVISADTIVVLDNKILGKPANEQEAIETLALLSGKKHQVLTGFAIFHKDKAIVDIAKTDVTFNNLSEELIKAYVKSKSPLDKAGSYGIQDNEKYPLIRSIKGGYYNVVGFPYTNIKKKIKMI